MRYSEIEKRAESGDHCFLFRDAIQRGWINRQHELTRTGLWMRNYCEDRKENLESHLCEALACALYHDERAIACRACFQATDAMARLKAVHNWAGCGYWEDALRNAQQRIERWGLP
jgi:hypothetical protein